jgi:hypothetical protein
MSEGPNPNSSPLGNLTQPSSSLGSLAQSARGKQLKTAQWLMIVVGILTVAINGIVFKTIEDEVDRAIQKEITKVQGQGMQVDQAAVQKIRTRAIHIGQLIAGSAVALGVVFIVLGALVKKFPVPCTIFGLVLYIGATAIYGYLAPETLVQGLIWKIVTIVVLVKSVQSAVSYQQSEKSLSGDGTVAPV